eukprot:SM000222S06990  [mRNA]  locus=s222:121320:122865:- [translate_table: standard]
MGRATFAAICGDIGRSIAKEDTIFRKAVPVEQRVAIALYRLATGDALHRIGKRFGVGTSTVHKVVIEVCAAINAFLLPKYVQWPGAAEEAAAAADFEALSGIPGVVAALYTTHIPIKAPRTNLAAYYNKRMSERSKSYSYSLTVQAAVDARGAFTDVCIGWPGSLSNEKVLRSSALFQRGIGGALRGLWIAAPASFPLLDWLLVPYGHQEQVSWPMHAFNQKHAELVKVAQDAFGRLKGRWKFLQNRSEMKIQELPALLGACCVLHNICEKRNEGVDPDLAYEVKDDDMLPDSGPWHYEAVQARDGVAQALLQSLQLDTAFTR